MGNVVVQEDYERFVQVALARLPSKSRVDLLTNEEIARLDEGGEAVCVDKTFLDVPRVIRRPNSVTQSTGEAHGRMNHRRIVVHIPSASDENLSTQALLRD